MPLPLYTSTCASELCAHVRHQFSTLVRLRMLRVWLVLEPHCALSSATSSLQPSFLFVDPVSRSPLQKQLAPAPSALFRFSLCIGSSELLLFHCTTPALNAYHKHSLSPSPTKMSMKVILFYRVFCPSRPYPYRPNAVAPLQAQLQ